MTALIMWIAQSIGRSIDLLPIRNQLNEGRTQLAQFGERVAALQHELQQAENTRADAEGQLKQASVVLSEKSESEQHLLDTLGKLNAERQALSDRFATLQRQFSAADGERTELAKNSDRLDRERSVLKKTLDRVERLRVTAEDSSARGTIERGQLELALRRLDDENKARTPLLLL